ncbi:MAG: C_GCAxxG_C_C family protein [Clostridia bacterium]|nr:C_GCAxxG_C_C family protein [Clostridia bacterium]MBT7121686.1 C_GCAxxG_C_C family protein [Clostridia bacterium]
MTEKRQRAKEIFYYKNNCAQTVLVVFAEDIGLDEQMALKLTLGIAGGFKSRETCGAVAAAVMVIGAKCSGYSDDVIETKNYCTKKVHEFMEKFKQRNESAVCADLITEDMFSDDEQVHKAAYRQVKEVCPKVVDDAIDILESMEFNACDNKL